MGDSEGPKILVAPWGNPFEWKEAVYHFNGKEFRAKTTLLPMMEVLKPDKVILIIPETLSCVSERSLENLKKYAQEESVLLDHHVEALKGDPRRYGEILANLQELIRSFCRSEVGVEDNRLDVMIAPNIGRYRCPSLEARWEIPKDSDIVSIYSSYVLQSVVNTVNFMIRGDVRMVTMILDTTHGINFMPLAAYDAVLPAARAISAAHRIEVVFRQYNSTPFPIGVKDPSMDIYLVKEERLFPNKAAQRLVYSFVAGGEMNRIFVTSESERYGEEIEWLKKELSVIKKMHSSSRALVSSIHYSLPLALLQFALEIRREASWKLGPDRIEEFLKRSLCMVEIHDDPSRIPRELTIRRVAVPEYRSIKACLSAWALICYAKRALDSLDSSNLRIIDSETKSMRVSVTEGMLEKVLENYLRGPLYDVALHEISKIRRDKKRAVNTERTRQEGCETVRRNFIAHSGLPPKSIDIKQEDGSLWISYKAECLDTVKRLSERALNETERLISKGHERPNKQ